MLRFGACQGYTETAVVSSIRLVVQVENKWWRLRLRNRGGRSSTVVQASSSFTGSELVLTGGFMEEEEFYSVLTVNSLGIRSQWQLNFSNHTHFHHRAKLWSGVTTIMMGCPPAWAGYTNPSDWWASVWVQCFTFRGVSSWCWTKPQIYCWTRSLVPAWLNHGNLLKNYGNSCFLLERLVSLQPSWVHQGSIALACVRLACLSLLLTSQRMILGPPSLRDKTSWSEWVVLTASRYSLTLPW